jgi:sterol desaturase/sphingolipid hydroxylase (fatty acid hydroxylase superfamily)
MKQAVLFTLSFVALSLVLTWLWLTGGNAVYAEMMEPVAREVYDWLGIHGQGTLRRKRFINFVPFTALMLLTPRLTLRKRLLSLVGGWVILAASHLTVNAIAMGTEPRNRLPLAAAFTSDAMPFLIWYVLARDFVQETLHRARHRGKMESDSQVESPDDA